MFDADVFVLGGGPAGLAAAIAMRRTGLRVILADAARPPIDKACGEGLMPDSLAAARELGILRRWRVNSFASISPTGLRTLACGAREGSALPASARRWSISHVGISGTSSRSPGIAAAIVVRCMKFR